MSTTITEREQTPVDNPRTRDGHLIEPEPRFHDWDQTPHGFFLVRASQVGLSDVLLGGTHQVEGIGRANQRGAEALRFDLNYIVERTHLDEYSGRLVLPLDHLVEIKRYLTPAGDHTWAYTKLKERRPDGSEYPAALIPDYGRRTSFCCSDTDGLNPHGYEPSAIMCDVCAPDWEADYYVLRHVPEQ